MRFSDNRISINGTYICTVLSFKSTARARKVISQALDGTTYIQTVGTGTQAAAVEFFAPSLDIRRTMDAAATEGAELTIAYAGNTYTGFIEGDITWETVKKDTLGAGQFSFIIRGTT